MKEDASRRALPLRHTAERLGQVPAEEPEHEGVRLLRPETAAVGGQGVGEKLLEIGLLHVFICDLEKAMTDEVAAGGDRVSARNLRRVAALVQQAADEAGASDGASQLIRSLRRTQMRRERCQ